MRQEGISSYVLHTRPFKDTSLLVDLFCDQKGIVSVVAKGAKRPRSRWAGIMQPFLLLNISCMGKSDLKTLISAEAMEPLPCLAGKKILLGLYLNELLIRLLRGVDSHSALFSYYDATLRALACTDEKREHQILLRKFELGLLAELGYGVNLTTDAKTEQPIVPELLYGYDAQVGLYEVSSQSVLPLCTISGASVRALESGCFSDESQLREAKLLMRYILSIHLEGKALQSHKLFLARR